jgi:hypothetical protein
LICLVQCCLCEADWYPHHLVNQYQHGHTLLTSEYCVHHYIESGRTEYDYLSVVARVLELVGGRLALALVEGKVPQQHLARAKAVYGTVNKSAMTKRGNCEGKKPLSQTSIAA